VFQTASDGTTVKLSSCDFTSPQTFTVSGPMTGLAPNEAVDISARFTSSFIDDEHGTYTMQALPGKGELFARSTSFTDHTQDKVIRKALDVTADQTIPLDFASDAVLFDTAPLTIADPTARTTSQIYSGGTLYSVGFSFPSSTAYQILPAALRKPDDLIQVHAQVQDGRTSSVITTGGPVSLALPAAVTVPMPALVTDGYVRPHVMFPVGGGTLPLVTYVLDYFTFNFTTDRVVGWDAEFSEAWTAGATTVDFTVPDFSSLTGFDAKLELEDHQAIVGFVARDESSSLDVAVGVKQQTAGTDFTLGSYCGDGITDPGEACDDAGESATCDADCTAVSCGDGYTNVSAGEECDPPDGVTCSDTCTVLPPPPAKSSNAHRASKPHPTPRVHRRYGATR
jgi:hypothetical protein